MWVVVLVTAVLKVKVCIMIGEQCCDTRQPLPIHSGDQFYLRTNGYGLWSFEHLV